MLAQREKYLTAPLVIPSNNGAKVSIYSNAI